MNPTEMVKCPDCGGVYKPKDSPECPWCEKSFLEDEIRSIAAVTNALLKPYLTKEAPGT